MPPETVYYYISYEIYKPNQGGTLLLDKGYSFAHMPPIRGPEGIAEIRQSILEDVRKLPGRDIEGLSVHLTSVNRL